MKLEFDYMEVLCESYKILGNFTNYCRSVKLGACWVFPIQCSR
jgi:hypothetical protein